MQLPGPIGLISVLILACNSEDKGWKINVNRNITAKPGSTVTIQCNFSYPQQYHTNDVKVFWKNSAVIDQSNCSKNDIDKMAFVFHPNNVCLLGKYKGKTKLIGDKDKGDCSLQIINIMDSEENIYVRIFVENEKYSYKDGHVSISVNGVELDRFKTVAKYYTTPALSTTETTIKNETNPKYTTAVFVAIPVTVVAVIILLVAGIFICKKYKRSHSVTRVDSGYYENFSRALANLPKREAACDTQDKKLSERKAIDDPVYINVKAPTGHVDPNIDCVDNIYANVDYTN